MDAVERLTKTIEDGAALRDRWKSERLLLDENDDLRIWLGETAPDELGTLVERFRRHFDAPFPDELELVLSEYNGLAIESEPVGGIERVPADRLPEPTLWPANVYGDHFSIPSPDADAGATFFAIGEIADSGLLALRVHQRDAVSGVYWLDADFPAVDPHRLTDNFRTFLDAWCDAALSLPLLLAHADTPGWQAG